jgi:hypothetical protein
MFVALYCYLLHLVAVESAVASDSAAGRVLAYIEQVIGSPQSGFPLPVVTIAYAQTVDGSMYVYQCTYISMLGLKRLPR